MDARIWTVSASVGLGVAACCSTAWAGLTFQALSPVLSAEFDSSLARVIPSIDRDGLVSFSGAAAGTSADFTAWLGAAGQVQNLGVYAGYNSSLRARGDGSVWLADGTGSLNVGNPGTMAPTTVDPNSRRMVSTGPLVAWDNGTSLSRRGVNAGSTVVVAQVGTPVPGLPGATLGTAPLGTVGGWTRSLAMSGDGTVVFGASIAGGGPNAQQGVFRFTPGGQLQMIAALPISETIGDPLSGVTINDAGDVAFRVGGASWLARAAGPAARLVGSGTVLGSGLSVSRPTGAPLVNNAVHVFTPVTFTSSVASGLLITDGAGSRVIARSDASIPGAPAGWRYSTRDFGVSRGGDDAEVTGRSSFAINDLGQVVFGINSTSSDSSRAPEAIIAFDPLGGLFTVARVGGTLALPGYEGLAISALFLRSGSNGLDGKDTPLDQTGRLVFGVRFESGATLVVTTVIPAPGAGGLLALAGLVALRRRRV